MIPVPAVSQLPQVVVLPPSVKRPASLSGSLLQGSVADLRLLRVKAVTLPGLPATPPMQPYLRQQPERYAMTVTGLTAPAAPRQLKRGDLVTRMHFNPAVKTATRPVPPTRLDCGSFMATRSPVSDSIGQRG